MTVKIPETPHLVKLSHRQHPTPDSAFARLHSLDYIESNGAIFAHVGILTVGNCHTESRSRKDIQFHLTQGLRIFSGIHALSFPGAIAISNNVPVRITHVQKPHTAWPLASP